MGMTFTIEAGIEDEIFEGMVERFFGAGGFKLLKKGWNAGDGATRSLKFQSAEWRLDEITAKEVSK